jgi:hypothetical protein
VPADLPALTRLTEDVATAMRAAEARETASRLRRRALWRRGFPVGTLLLALVVATALALHAAPAEGGSGSGTVAKACGAGAGALVITGLATRRAGTPLALAGSATPLPLAVGARTGGAPCR